jgi:hypothetical protein
MSAATSLAGSVPLLKTLVVTGPQLEGIRVALMQRREYLAKLSSAAPHSRTKQYWDGQVVGIDALLLLVAKS